MPVVRWEHRARREGNWRRPLANTLGELVPRRDERAQENGADRAGVVAVMLLGPMAVTVDGRQVVLSAGRLRALLAVLAMFAGDTVSMARLASAMWGDDLPADARRTVQTYVARLRSLLGPGLIVSRPDGYLLRAEPDQVDALRFERLVDAAAAAAEPAEERTRLAEATALWRGVPFEGVQSAWLENSEAPRLMESYLRAMERQVDLDLADGWHGELVMRLRELVGRYPLRESLWVRLLVALHRGGRQAEALECYETVRLLLAEELGTDPGSDLQRVHADLLAGRVPEVSDGVKAAAARRPVPRQLPGSADFTGRDDTLAAIAEMFGGVDGPAQHGPVICAISGMAGIGKTALAVHAARQLAGRFPDGQLYVNLHGATPGLQAVPPLEVLGRFLRALGTDPAAVPADLEEASAAFRSGVASRRLLIVLDNAADAAQVAPLLPASPGCGVLVTSRRILSGLEGASHLHLKALGLSEALDLLGRLAGRKRVAAETEAAADVARCCGFLPLALQIAGARLAARPAWPVRALAGRLAGQEHRLDELELPEARVRASFAMSLQQLQVSDDPVDRAAAGAFGLLGVLDGPELSTPVVARLMDEPEVCTERALERLVDAQLLNSLAPGRYQLHDLLRLYARELAGEQHDEHERAAALTRALGFYVATTWQTLAVLRPGDLRLARIDSRWAEGGLDFADQRAALGWLEAERANLLAGVKQAAATPGVPAGIVVQLAQALAGFFWLRPRWGGWMQVNQIALEAAVRAGDRAGQAQAHNDLGLGHWQQGRYAEALGCLRKSLALWRELGDRWGEGASLRALGIVYERQGHYEEALACQQQSLAVTGELGNRRESASTLANLGTIYRQQGRYQQALACMQESLAMYRAVGDRQGEAIILDNLGALHERQGRYDQAMACLEESLAICRSLSDSDGQAYSLNDLGVVYRRQGRHDQALACQRESLAIRRDLGDRYGQARSLHELGLTLRELGRAEEARQHWREALAIFEQLRTSDADQVRGLLAGPPC